MMKIRLICISAFVALGSLVACRNEADRASYNLSQDADNFKIVRKVDFYNTRLGINFLEMIGRCALGNSDTPGRSTVTCKVGPDSYKKNYLGLSQDVTIVVEQLEPAQEDTYMYKVTWAPRSIIPNINIQ